MDRYGQGVEIIVFGAGPIGLLFTAALAADGKAILYSSHVLDIVERVCDRALIIHEGRLIADGSLEALKASTERGSLEDVFRQLTHTEGAVSGISELIESLRS